MKTYLVWSSIFEKKFNSLIGAWRCISSGIQLPDVLCSGWNWLPNRFCRLYCHLFRNHWRSLHRVSTNPIVRCSSLIIMYKNILYAMKSLFSMMIFRRGSLLSTAIFVYAATSPVNGYFGGGLYSRMGGKLWIRQVHIVLKIFIMSHIMMATIKRWIHRSLFPFISDVDSRIFTPLLGVWNSLFHQLYCNGIPRIQSHSFRYNGM